MSLSLEHAKEARIMKTKKKSSILTRVTGHLWIPCHRSRSTQERSKNVCKQRRRRRRRGRVEAAAQETKEQSVGFLQRPPASSPFPYIRIKYIHLYISYTHTYLHTRIRMYDLYFVVYSFFLFSFRLLLFLLFKNLVIVMFKE
jgi:hypothetical protein